MTQGQTYTIRVLLAGGYIIECRNPKGERQDKLFQGNMSPVRWIKALDRPVIAPLLRWGDKWKKDRQVIDLRKVRALHGNHTIKKMYNEFRRSKKAIEQKS